MRKYDFDGVQIWNRSFDASGITAGRGVTVDSSGVYMTGFTFGAFPGYTNSGGRDVFVRAYDHAGTELWVSQFGRLGEYDLVPNITSDASGIYVAGNILEPGQTSVLAQNGFVRKYDSGGNELWERQIDSVIPTPETDLAQTTDTEGNTYVAGVTGGVLPGQTSAGSSDAFLRKYDASGNELWTRQFGTSGSDKALGITVDATAVYVSGRTAGAFPDQTSSGNTDAFVRKYDLYGTLIWTRQFGGAANDQAFGISVNGSAVYVTGDTSGILPNQVSSGGIDVFVRKYDEDGTEQWTRQFGTTSTDTAFDIFVDAGSVFLAGLTAGTFDGQINAGGEDALLLKLDPDGNELWTRQFGSSSDDRVSGVSVDASGVYLAGKTGGSLPGQTSEGSEDAFLRKYDLSGTELWTRQFGTSAADAAHDLAMNDAGIYVAGQTDGSFPNQSSAGATDAFVHTYDADGNLLWTRQFGTASSDKALAISANAAGVYASGVTDGVFSGQTNPPGLVFVARLAPGIDPPVDLDNAINQVAELSASGTPVGLTAFVNDPDGNPITYSLTDDAGGRFAIDPSSGVVTVADGTLLDFESMIVHDIRVLADSGVNGRSSVTFSIGITNVQEAPQITSPASVVVEENQENVIDVQSNGGDGETEGNGLTYSLSGGADQGLFSIDADTGVLTFNSAPDFENPGDVGGDNVYNVQVTVIDTSLLTGVQDFTVTVDNVNEAPFITSTSMVSIPENEVSVLDVQSSDADGETEGAGLTYQLTGGADRFLFWIDFYTGVLTFRGAPDFENPLDSGSDNIYDVQVTVRDSGFLTAVQDMTVTVTNVQEPTVSINSITQDGGLDFKADAEISHPLGLPLSGAVSIAGQQFIDLSTLPGNRDYIEGSEYIFGLDGDGHPPSISSGLIAGCGDIGEGPVSFNYNGPTDLGAICGGGNKWKNPGWTITVQSKITGMDYVLTMQSWEVPTSYFRSQELFSEDYVERLPNSVDISTTGLNLGETYTLKITAEDGLGANASDTEDFTYQGENQLVFNEAPFITGAAAVNAVENQTSVIDVQSSDADGETETGGGLTYSLSGGADQGLFSIDVNTGMLTFNAAPDFENPGDDGADNVYDVQVAVTDAGLLVGVQDLVVTVTDVNETPTVTNPIPDVAVDQNAASDVLDLSSTFADVDAGDSLTLSVVANTDASLIAATINGTNLTLDYLPNQNGTAEITVRATDSGGLFVDDTFTAIVLFSAALDIRLRPNEPTVQIFEDAGDLVVLGTQEFFRGSLDTFTGIVIDGPNQSNDFVVNVDNLPAAVLPGGITINAGEAGNSDNDTLVVNGSQTVTNYEYTTGGPESGTIEMDGLLIIFTEFEPIIDNLPVINRVFSIGTAGGQTIRLLDDGVPGNNMSTIDDDGTGAFEKITFASPANTLEINAGDGDDLITVAQLDNAFAAVLTINAEAGNDSVDARNYNLPARISGGIGNDHVWGGSADDVIEGGDGNDTLDGGPGNDEIEGGLGDDNVTVDAEDVISVAEGDSLNPVLSVSGTQEGDMGTIDWGDGTTPDPVVVSGGTISSSHVYTEESTAMLGGVYTAVLSINSTTIDIEVTVDNTPPTLAISGPATVLEGATYTLDLTATDPGSDTISGWTITWGDGGVQPIVGNPSSALHQFPPGLASYSISATATDEDGTYSSNSLTIFAGDLPPVAAINSPTNGVRGQTRDLVLTATDTPPDEEAGFTFQVDFGDGSSQTINPASGNGSGLTVEHVYSDAGSYTINVIAIDQSSPERASGQPVNRDRDRRDSGRPTQSRSNGIVRGRKHRP